MEKVFCFGELLLRLSFNQKWQQLGEANANVYVGGSEKNVATALAKWQIATKYFTALPDNYLSGDIIDQLKNKNIDTTSILLSGNKIGMYYLPLGADLKHAGVIYDRANSSFAELKTGIINWDDALKGCTWFHFSAISPALNPSLAAVCKEALQAASAKGMTISVDLNYRAKLWQYGIHPEIIMRELLPYCHVVMGNIWSAETLLGIKHKVENSSGCPQQELIDAAEVSIKQLQQKYPKLTHIAYTFRMPATYFGILQKGETIVTSTQLKLDNIVDQSGSGDCFMAGLIYGLCHTLTLQQTVDFAALAAVSKIAEKGDSTNQDIRGLIHNTQSI